MLKRFLGHRGAAGISISQPAGLERLEGRSHFSATPTAGGPEHYTEESALYAITDSEGTKQASLQIELRDAESSSGDTPATGTVILSMSDLTAGTALFTSQVSSDLSIDFGANARSAKVTGTITLATYFDDGSALVSGTLVLAVDMVWSAKGATTYTTHDHDGLVEMELHREGGPVSGSLTVIQSTTPQFTAGSNLLSSFIPASEVSSTTSDLVVLRGTYEA